MRAGWLVGAVVVGWAALAGAAEPQVVPVAIQPFRARCFDDKTLAERVRARLPAEVPVTVGRSPKGAHQTVRVSGEAGSIVVQVTARNESWRVVGTDRRVLPAEGDCASLLEMTALIIARAATPLSAREAVPVDERRRTAAEERAREERAHEDKAREERAREDKAREERARADQEAAAERQREREHERELGREEERAREREREREREGERERERERLAQLQRSDGRRSDPKLPPDKLARRPVDPGRRRFELDALALWIFPLDGAPSTATGELSAGYSWPRLGVALRVGVSDDWSASAASTAGPISVAARRIPLALEMHVDFRVRGGCVRLGGGPLFALWSVHSTGIPRQPSSLLFEPGAQLRASYRWELGRVVLQAGVAADFMFVADDISVAGVGTIARTPLVELAPFLSAGVQL